MTETMKAAMLLSVKSGLRKSRSGSTGSTARRSTAMNPASVTSPAAYMPRMAGEPQASVVPPSDVGTSSRMRVIDSSAMPALSMTVSRGVCSRWRKRLMPK